MVIDNIILRFRILTVPFLLGNADITNYIKHDAITAGIFTY